MCGRPVEVPSRYAGKDFVHSICGSTLRMAVLGEGEQCVELVATPELEEKVAVDLEAIRKSESHGLFLPRHLRENSLSHAGESAAYSSDVLLSPEEGPGKASARLTRALSSPVEATADRLRKVQLIRDSSKSSRLRARFSRTVDDSPGNIHRTEESGLAGEPAGRSRSSGKKNVSMAGAQGNGNVASGKMNDTRKLVIVVFALMVLAAVMFMMVRFLPGG